MGLVTKETIMKWNARNIGWYKNKGYIYTKISDEFIVKVEDLTSGSSAVVDVKCDDCEKDIKNIKYCDYKKYLKDGKYYCTSCARKHTLEEVNQEFIIRNLIPLFNEYKNAHGILLAKTQEGYLVITRLNSLKNGQTPNIFDKSNPYTIQNIKLWCKLNDKPFELIDKQEYKGNKKYLKWRCLKDNCGEIFESNWSNILQGNGCGCCNGMQVRLSNCLATKRPDLIKYLKNKEDGYKYTEKSQKQINLICPECGYEKDMTFNTLSNYGFACNKCRDSISYPEKFMFCVLEQLHLDFISQLSKNTLEWCKKYRYDFYIPKFNYIIETHGGQHYKEGFSTINSNKNTKTLEEIMRNDNTKMKLALNNGINNYIVIDCRKSELEWIKNSIIQSELPQLLDFKEEDIDWLKCHEYACCSLVKVVCDMWNKIKKIQTIADELKLDRNTIRRYLKKGSELNWCDYNAKEEAIKNLISNHKNRQKQIILINTREVFNSVVEASKKYNIKYNNIFNFINDRTKSAGIHPITGDKMVWMYYDEYLNSNKNVI